MGQPVVHFEVVGNDADLLHAFYSQLFGWEIDADNPLRYGNVDRDAAGIRGGIGAFDGPDHVTFYVEVPDVEAALATADRLGGSRLLGPVEVPGTEYEIGHFTDPEGHLIGLTRSNS